MKRLSTILFIIAVVFFLPTVCLAQSAEREVNAYLFYGVSCPHCAKEKEYLHDISENKYPGLRLYEYEVYFNTDNSELLQETAEALGAEITGVPFLVIGDKTFSGYDENWSPMSIEWRIYECTQNQCPDSVARILGVTAPYQETIGDSVEENNVENLSSEISETTNLTDRTLDLPFFGEVRVANFSLPILAVVMGALDGFNPCAMWTLLFLISLLLGLENKKRMWILGAAFIIASAAVYFLFMAAWLNLILFIGFVFWVRLLIGILATGGGIYSIKEFFTNKSGGCKVAGSEKRKITFEKLKSAVKQNSLWLALAGIIALAFVVNLVELVCSAGLPAIFTQVLAMNQLSSWQYYLYILLYIFFFMLDDLIIFFVAMFTLQMVGMTTKYARVSRLIGGLIMLAIGILLVFRPEWLMFG